jgi:hypothetical protein
MSDGKTTLTGGERQFLIESSNPAGRVAGHNNRMALKFEAAGLVRRDHRSIQGQSNFLITDVGRAILDNHNGQ